MKKFQRLAVAMMAILLAFGTSACGVREQGEEVDENRTQVYVNYYNGGLGNEWLPALKKAFEDKYPHIQIMPLPGKNTMDSGTVLNNFDTYEGDLFFMDYVGSEHLTQFRTKGYSADITKYVRNEKLTPFGEDKTIWDKITPSVKDYYDLDGAVYSLPWYQASYQMIYDIELFESQSFYVDPDGNWNNGSNKSLGQDGVAGTYDDGLPVTQTDFFNLLNRMVEKNVLPLTFYGSGAYYFTSYLTNMFADYEGYNDFMLNYILEGQDSDLGTVTLEDAYRLKNGQKGKRYILEFAERLMGNAGYYSSNTFQTSQDNFTAQDEFLLSVELAKKSSSNKRIAMLVDGPWWEREASATMNDMAGAYKNENYAYGKRAFGIMPMPQADDGSSAEGNTIACTSGRSVIFMNNNSKVKDEAGLFLQFCHSEEGLRIATVASGIMRPYDYEMQEENLNEMTPFGKLVYGHNKSANVVFEELPISKFLQAEGSAYCSYLFTMVSSADTTANIAKYFQPGQAGHTVEAYLAGMAIEQTPWQDAVEEYRFRTEN